MEILDCCNFNNRKKEFTKHYEEEWELKTEEGQIRQKNKHNCLSSEYIKEFRNCSFEQSHYGSRNRKV